MQQLQPMQPKLIGSGDRMIYTVYHPAKSADDQTNQHAVLICPPFGQEAIRSHKCLRLLADRLARQGVHVMRLAYRGTDDSAWWSDEVHRLQDWIEDIQLAKQELQTASGCATVGLIGLRLGANLAAEVARANEDVHSVILWEPIEDGHRFLSDIRRMQAEMVDLWHCPVRASDNDEVEELLSTRYQRSLLAEIERLKLDTSDLQQPTVKIVAENRNVDSIAVESPDDSQIVRDGMEKRFRSHDPHGWSELADLEVVWWRPQTVQRILAEVAQISQRLEQSGWFQQWGRVNGSFELDECDCVESVHSFGSAGQLTGVLNQPDSDRAVAGAPVVLMLNAGIVHRVGPFRLHVDIARTLNQQGFTSFRFDLSGLGDSQARTGKLDKNGRVELDVAEAIEYLQSNGLGDRFIVLGLCSGAYHGHHVALNHPQIVGGIYIDGIVFPTVGFYVRHYFLRMLQFRFWRNALKRRWQRWRKGNHHDREQTGKRLAEAEYFQIDKSRAEVAAEIQALKDRSLQMLFVFTGAYENYRGQKQFQEMWGIEPDDQVQVEYMPESEHTFRMVAHREKLCRRIGKWMQDRMGEQGREGGTGLQSCPETGVVCRTG